MREATDEDLYAGQGYFTGSTVLDEVPQCNGESSHRAIRIKIPTGYLAAHMHNHDNDPQTAMIPLDILQVIAGRDVGGNPQNVYQKILNINILPAESSRRRR